MRLVHSNSESTSGYKLLAASGKLSLSKLHVILDLHLLSLLLVHQLALP